MNANELRQGNLILGSYEQEIDRGNGIIEDVECEDVVTFIGYEPFEKYFWVEGGEVDEYDKFNPIPLTEEWLERFGFISDPYQDMYIKGWLQINCDKTRGKLEFWVENVKGKVVELEFVHHLQNFYYDCEREELTLKK